MVCIPTSPRTGWPAQAGNHSKMNMNVTGLTEPGDIVCLRDRKTVLIMTCVFFGLNISADDSMMRSIGSAYLSSPVMTSRNRLRRKCAIVKRTSENCLTAESFKGLITDLSQISDNLFGIPLLKSPHEPLYPFKLDSKEAIDLMI